MIAQIFSLSTWDKGRQISGQPRLYHRYSLPLQNQVVIFDRYACGLHSYLCTGNNTYECENHCRNSITTPHPNSQSFPSNLLLPPNHFQPPLSQLRCTFFPTHAVPFGIFPWYIWHEQGICLALPCTDCVECICTYLWPSEQHSEHSTTNHNLDPETQAEKPSPLTKTKFKARIVGQSWTMFKVDQRKR